MTMTKHIQEAVAGFVAERGYRDGYSASGFAVRQILKATEELGEIVVALGMHLPGLFVESLLHAANEARSLFDQGWGDEWGEITPQEAREVLAELADLQVVLFCAAEALAEILGEDFDLARAALEKAKADVKRGVR